MVGVNGIQNGASRFLQFLVIFDSGLGSDRYQLLVIQNNSK
jgi:hypothetical protein